MRAKGTPANWKDLGVFMDLGTKLRTPKSISELKAGLEKASIRIDAEFPAKGIPDQDPWFGIFYKETNLKSFIERIRE